MSIGLQLFDLSLCILLLVLAMSSMISKQLSHAVMLYIAFGLMMALAWARLAAPDLALAEAAIGAGLTGALCFSALARQTLSAVQSPISLAQRLWPALFVLVMLAGLLSAILQQPLADAALPALVYSHLAASGVEHPITAVLLHFRSWDTLLELVVLLLALVGAMQVSVPFSALNWWPLSLSWSRLLGPVVLLIAGYILWAGASQPGGAFQAGALLAAGAVVLRLNQQLPWLSWQNSWVRALALSGVAVFVFAGLLAYGVTLWLSPVATDAVWLSWPTPWAGGIILLIELFATLSIAVTLTLLVVGEPKRSAPLVPIAGAGDATG